LCLSASAGRKIVVGSNPRLFGSVSAGRPRLSWDDEARPIALAEETMSLRSRSLVVAWAALALALPSTARAGGGLYDIEGGTSAERAQIPAALEASSFDWGIVRERIHFHIRAGVDSYATRGEIWIDADLLDSGRFAWAIVQHEYAHQVDFFRLTDPQRGMLLALLGGLSWWDERRAGVAHAQLGSERFASTLAWSYWPSSDNSLRPSGPADECAGMPPAQFRALIERMLGSAAAPSTAPTVVSHAPRVKRQKRRRAR
jgi:hypothetical protein